MRPALVTLLVFIAACGNNAQVPSTTVSLPGDESTAPPTSSTTTTLAPTTSTTAADPPPPLGELAADALITPTGVVVAVLEQSPTGYLVRTPCGNEEMVSTGTPVGGIDVVLDPGHGGEIDTGAEGSNGLSESELNLEVAQAVEAKLIVRGIPVILSRTANYASILSVRTGLADHLGADLLLSIHHNAPTQGASNRPGTEVFVQHESDESRRLGGLVWSHVTQALSRFNVDWSAANDAGVMTVLSTRGEDAYGINRNAETVSIIAELGYISNPPEAALFATDEYVEAAAEALADAIEDYLTTEEPGSGFVAEGRVFNPQPGIGGRSCVDPDLE
jgi:N-acetylmuramoyl-L-alanine amidase